MTDGTPVSAIATVVVVVFLALLPIFVISARSRLILNIAVLLLSCLGIAAAVGGALLSKELFGVSLVFALPVAGGFWFAALLCALAAWADAAHERRAREMTLRLLLNNPQGLGKLSDYKAGWFS